MRRYAVYAAPPPESPLARRAAAWLGRDPYEDAAVPQPTVPGIGAERQAAITASPRLYGFHATLKAPFSLAEGIGAERLHAAVRDLARSSAPVRVPLRLGSLGGFLALVPDGPAPAVSALADICVTELDHLRAPLDEAELARRRRSGLTPAEDAHLVRFGYPHVLELFRYHMTLTERLAAPEHDMVRAILERLVARFCPGPFALDALAVFEQPDRGCPFVVTGRYPLGG
jgi:putative phosphonate metabolism protein